MWTARMEYVPTYTEFCKQPQPGITAKEIQRKLVDDSFTVCLNLC